MAIPVTYSLLTDRPDSDAYYRRIREFTDEVIKRSSESLKTSTSEFKEYVRTSGMEEPRRVPRETC